MTRDLGTYYVRVELADGRGWIQAFNTSRRFTNGCDGCFPLDAQPIPPTWDSEEELFHSIVYMFTEGNYSCDCNKVLFLARAAHADDPEDQPCTDSLPIMRLTAIRPDGTEHVLFVSSEGARFWGSLGPAPRVITRVMDDGVETKDGAA